ncbi:MAG: MarC family protein [Bacteroidales bacterium]
MISTLNFTEILSAFVLLFAIIDILGSVPILLGLKNLNREINARKACVISLVMFLVFFFAGDAIFNLFNVDIASFAVAGSFVIFILALEMILGIEIMKNEGNNHSATIIPTAFPLIAGPGALTTFLSLRAEYHVSNIFIGLILNLILVYFVLRYIDKIEAFVGSTIIFILRKFFGVILLAIAVKLFITNLLIILARS